MRREVCTFLERSEKGLFVFLNQRSHHSCRRITHRHRDQGLRGLVRRRRKPSSSTHTDHGCHNDTWSTWTFRSAYKWITHTQNVLQLPSDDPYPDDDLKSLIRKKIIHYRQIYEDKSDPIIFLSDTMNTSGRVYDDFVRLFWFHPHRETTVLTGELQGIWPVSFSV